jgi:glycosyltransferase involved in cell wall biosynthesis
MSTPPLVSVVVPAYNAATTVEATLRSILDQTVEDLEVIVVDDGSQDRTVEVVRQLDDPRITVLEQANRGPSSARNKGLAAARGRYVALLDADDLWLPDKLERQLGWLEQHPDVKSVQTGVFFVNDALDVVSVRRCAAADDVLLQTLRFQNLPAVPSTLLAERERIAAAGGFDTSLAILEDWNLAIQLARTGDLGSIEDPLALYRVHPGNRSRGLEQHVEPGLTVLDRLFADPTLPQHIRRQQRRIYGRLYAMLAGGAYRNREWVALAKWSARALLADPRIITYMLALPVRRWQRAST